MTANDIFLYWLYHRLFSVLVPINKIEPSCHLAQTGGEVRTPLEKTRRPTPVPQLVCAMFCLG